MEGGIGSATTGGKWRGPAIHRDRTALSPTVRVPLTPIFTASARGLCSRVYAPGRRITLLPASTTIIAPYTHPSLRCTAYLGQMTRRYSLPHTLDPTQHDIR